MVRKIQARVTGALTRHNRPILTCAGLSCMVASAFTYTVWAGLLASGVAFLALEWSLNE